MKYLNSYKTWLFLVYALLIILFSLSSNIQIKYFPELWKYDKLIHFFEYFILGFLFLNMLSIERLILKRLFYSIIFMIIFPVLDEALQYFTPTRIPDINDVLYDFIGGTLGSFLRYYFK